MTRPWQIGITGTFDVANYGDLLFPLLAESELRARLGEVQLHRFSYHARRANEWPYDVTSVSELPNVIDRLDAMLIGGGFLIRFDKFVAENYLPPSPDIHHPTGYWLTPALMALSRGIPVAWNAPGMHCNDIPGWAAPLLELAFGESAYVSVRDEPSRAALAQFTSSRIEVVPDSAFGLARLIPATPSDELRALREAAGLTKKYIVVQPIRWRDEGFDQFLAAHADRLRDYQLLALPMGPVLGDDNHVLDGATVPFIKLPHWPDPRVVAELIAGSEAVVGYSYHLAITALAAGVPVFTSVDLDAGKFTALREHASVHRLSSIHEGIDAFLGRLGRTAPLDSVCATLAPVATHWDRIADAVRGGRRAAAPSFSRFWQTLPSLLENEAASWPGRDSIEGEAMIVLQQIARATLRHEPFQWATIDRLYSSADAAELAATYPRDHFKLVEGYGGEKDYQYEARPLIPMGSREIAFRDHLSSAWRRLAEDLISPMYRNALSKLTGVDLSDALMEVNVFHYGPGASLGPHPDLPDKLVTHVLYFNETWSNAAGGCLTILRSKNEHDVAAVIPPVVGNSAVLVRSDNSWHAVSPVVRKSRLSRRSVTVTFYRPGSVSSMWPEHDATPLRDYQGGRRRRRWWWPFRRR